jgi:DNA repair protein RAD5
MQGVARFIFPVEPAVDGVIDLCDEEEAPFYFNPYSGELSLEFPKSTEHSCGGILACVCTPFLAHYADNSQ